MQTLWAGSVLLLLFFFFLTPSSIPIALKSLASQASFTLRIHGSSTCYYDCCSLGKTRKGLVKRDFSAARALIVLRKPNPPVQPTLRSMCHQTRGLKGKQRPFGYHLIGVELKRGESTMKNTRERAGRDTPYSNGNSNRMLSLFLPV